MPPSNDNIILKLYFTAKLQRALTRGTILWSLCRDKNIYINIYSTLTYTTLNPWATFLKSHPTGLQSFDWQQPLTLWKYKFWASRTKLIFSVSSGTTFNIYDTQICSNYNVTENKFQEETSTRQTCRIQPDLTSK